MTAAATDPASVHQLTAMQRFLTLTTVVLASSLYGTALLTTSTILPQMQGAMSATQDEIAWAMTFNILATAIVTPMTGWLVARFGEKRVMVWSIGVFTLSTLLCGMAQSLETLVFWRIIQGGTGAPVVPLSQTILLNTFPRRQQFRMHARPSAVAHADRDVDIGTIEIGEPARGVDAQKHIGVAGEMPRQPGQQPFRGEGRRHRYHQRTLARLVGQSHRLRELAKAGAQPGREDGAELRRHQSARRSFEQRLSKLFFRALDLLADAAGRDVQLGGCRCERSKPGGGFDGTQAIEVDTVQDRHPVFLNLLVSNLN